MLGIKTPVAVAIGITLIVALIIERTVIGRASRRWAEPRVARAAGLEINRYQIGAYVGANLLYCSAGVLLAGIVQSPSAFQGDTFLSRSPRWSSAAPRCSAGRSVIATAVGALFISQLDQFVLTSGVKSAVQYLVQAGALGTASRFTACHGVA